MSEIFYTVEFYCKGNLITTTRNLTMHYATLAMNVWEGDTCSKCKRAGGHSAMAIPQPTSYN